MTDRADAIEPTLRVTRNGPYVVTGEVRLTDHLGVEIQAPPKIELCRCGGSAKKPFCDGSHKKRGFSGDKEADRLPDRRDVQRGVGLTVLDNRGLCAHAGYCTAIVGEAFHAESEPFATPNGARADDLIRAARRCPSGALSVAFGATELRAAVDWDRPAEIVVSKDGPFYVRGGIHIVEDDGRPVERNEGASLEHATLCRCGNSKNKPFCSGMHWTVNFTDPLEPTEPTIFEYAGGLPALTELLRVFYGKYIPEDDLLRPVFLQMSADHPERVAAWLGEVFGGPKLYSEKMGGYAAMISQHLGRALDEDKRKRWVALLIKAADEVGLSNNAEFRAAFVNYLEWGTRLAVENSQQDAKPPPNMPMPLWTWDTAAGPPWGRLSAFPDKEAPHVVNLPDPSEPIGFDGHIKTLFRKQDRESMKWAFDLWSHDDVKNNIDKILGRIEDGSMPPDKEWPPEWVAALKRWVSDGMPASP